jgi:hypothetical protein
MRTQIIGKRRIRNAFGQSLLLAVVVCGMSSVSETVRASHIPWDEANYLALETSGALVAPVGLTDRIKADLSLIRATFPEVANIYVRPSWAPGSVVVKLTAESYQAHLAGSYGELDPLLKVFGGSVADTFHTMPYLLISHDPKYHSERLSEVIATVKGVVGASADILLGDGNDIEVSGSRYTFTQGWGDCPAGCIHKERRTFVVTGGKAIAVPEAGTAILAVLGIVCSGLFRGRRNAQSATAITREGVHNSETPSR